tara:strand:+ start:603 stop:878 length:276 start_codon:yes stop_codon:yes gene_type:complete
MSRYDRTNLSKSFNGVLKQDTTIYKVISETENDIYVLTQEGDRFDQLASQYYGDPSLWWYIARANNIKFNNVPAGTVIRIPINNDSFDIGD